MPHARRRARRVAGSMMLPWMKHQRKWTSPSDRTRFWASLRTGVSAIMARRFPRLARSHTRLGQLRLLYFAASWEAGSAPVV